MLFRNSEVRPGWVCIALTGAHACAAQVADTGGTARVDWLAAADWPDPVAGLAALTRRHDLRQRRLLAVLDRPDYLISAMDAPELPRDEWRDALRWRLQELADFPVHDASIDLLEIPPHLSPRGRHPVLAVAAPHARLVPLTTAARSARLRWTAFDIAESALRNLSARCQPEGRAQALLHLGRSHGTLVITADGELLLSRHLDLTLEAARTDALQDPEAFATVADRIGLEVQRTIDSFERQFGDLALARLLLAPAGLDALRQHLAELIYVPVEALALDQLFDLGALPADTLADPAVQADAALALGAALRPHGN